MRKLLSLTSKHFVTGISPSRHYAKSGVFASAAGINPFVDPRLGSSQLGLLQTSASPTDISSSVVVDTPFARVSRVTGSNAGRMYILGASGHFYSMDLASPAAPTDLRSGTPITNPANGIVIYKTRGGTEYLYYWQQTQIGRWDLAGSHPTGWTDNQFTGLQSTTYHPVKLINDRVYYGNKDRIGMIYDAAGTPTNNLNVLDFPSDFLVTALEEDTSYLVAALTKNTASGVIGAETKVIFWDKSSPSWNKEWPINDFNIISMKRVGSFIYAVGSKGLWAFNFSTPPELIEPLSGQASAFGYANAADLINGAVLWGGPGYINAFGKFLPGLPNAYSQPYKIGSSDITLVDANNAAGNIIVGTAEPKLYKISPYVGGATGLNAETVYFDLGQEFDIKRIDVSFGERLTSGDIVSITVGRDESFSYDVWATIRHSDVGGVEFVKTVAGFGAGGTLVGAVPAEMLKLKITFVAGAAKIKKIDVYGTPRDR